MNMKGNLFFAVLDANDQILLHSRQSPDIPHAVINTGFSEFEFNGEKWLTFALESSHDDLLIVVGERSEIREEITEYIGGGLLFHANSAVAGWAVVVVAHRRESP